MHRLATRDLLSNFFPIDEGKPTASRQYTDIDLYKRKPADQLRYKTFDNRLVQKQKRIGTK